MGVTENNLPDICGHSNIGKFVNSPMEANVMDWGTQFSDKNLNICLIYVFHNEHKVI